MFEGNFRQHRFCTTSEAWNDGGLQATDLFIAVQSFRAVEKETEVALTMPSGTFLEKRPVRTSEGFPPLDLVKRVSGHRFFHCRFCGLDRRVLLQTFRCRGREFILG